MQVALILVNYNGQKYLPDLFDSLAKLDYQSDQADIFFIDNASDDGSLKWVKKNFGRLGRPFFVIKNKQNFGFAGGNNIGIKQALESKNYKYIVLLNIDTVVDKNWLTELIRTAESNSQIGTVQSLILLHDQPELINTAGNHLHYLGFGWSGQFKVQSSKFKVEDQIGYASGAAVLYRADELRQIGLFDEHFFMYHEDLELSWRIRLAERKIVLAQQSIVYHKYQFARHRKKWYLTERNRLLVYLTMYKLRTIILFIPIFLLTEVGILVYSLIGGWFWHKLRSYLAVLWSIGYIIKKRRKIAVLRQVSDKQILKYMTSKLDFPEIQNWAIKYLINPILRAYFQTIVKLVRW